MHLTEKCSKRRGDYLQERTTCEFASAALHKDIRAKVRIALRLEQEQDRREESKDL